MAQHTLVPILVRVIERDRAALATIRAAIQDDRDLQFDEIVTDVRSLSDAEIGIVNLSHLSASDKERVRLIGGPPGVVLVGVCENGDAPPSGSPLSPALMVGPLTERAMVTALARAKTLVLASRIESLSSLLAAYCSAEREVRTGAELPHEDEIEWIEADGNYIRIHAEKGTRTLRMTMMQAEEKFYDSDIVRAHRKWLVNLTKIAAVRADHEGTICLRMLSGVELAVGRAYRSAVRERLGITHAGAAESAQATLSAR